jgi:hypothetical protein
MSLRIGLVELYNLLGDNKGISFYYDDLPGVVVTIGFTREEDYPNDGDDDDEPTSTGRDGFH